MKPYIAALPSRASTNGRFGLLAALALLVPHGAHPQEDVRPSARAIAPIDITGNWVSLVTEEWIFRMVTPRRGDYRYVPLSAEGRSIADMWDPDSDSAAGEECKGYGAPAIMMLPTRLQITWQDDNTLQLETDTGMQTRLLHFVSSPPEGARTWQGYSVAEWELPGEPGSTGTGDDEVPAGALKVETSHLREGYLRKNGVPFSEDTFMAEYYNLLVEDDGNEYLAVQIFIEDPRYLTAHFVRTVHFKREPDDSEWSPTPCSAY